MRNVDVILDVLNRDVFQSDTFYSRDRSLYRIKSFFTDVELPPTRQETLMRVGSESLSLTYQANLAAAGRLNMPGVRLVLEDMYGLFREHRFREFPQTYRVLPGYYESGELRPTVKRHNSLPRHGIHRLQRSGMGSELLELREYVPGDRSSGNAFGSGSS